MESLESYTKNRQLFGKGKYIYLTYFSRILRIVLSIKLKKNTSQQYKVKVN